MLLYVSHPRYLEHPAFGSSADSPDRLAAVAGAAAVAGVADAVVPVEPREATAEELRLAHDGAYLDLLAEFCADGGGEVDDAGTVAGPRSWEAARLAAGAGLTAVEMLRAGAADAAFCAVRPPGHHARAAQAMGLCLLNNVAVTAAALAAAGERVLVVDWDAHHGNGIQDAFYDRADVAYVSWHQYPFYPWTGAAGDRGTGEGEGTTVNIPLPKGVSGDVYRYGIDDVLVPFAESFRPDWLLVAAGFDAHRADPMASLRLSAGDFADLAERVLALAPAGRRVVFLEGGYDLDALRLSAAATVAAMAGERFVPEEATSGGPGMDVVAEVAEEVRRAGATR